MKASLSTVAAVLAAQRRAFPYPTARKKPLDSRAAPQAENQPPDTATAVKS